MSGIINPFVFGAGGGGDPGFDFTNMLWRVRGSDIGGLSHLDEITTWDDTSGNNRDFSSADPDKPEFHTNQINGHPAVYFGGQSVQHSFVGPDISGLSLTEIDLFVVLKTDADPAVAAANGLWELNDADYVNAHTQYPNTGGTVHMTACLPSGQARLSVDPTPALTSFRLLRVTAKTGSNNYTMDLDGTNIAAGTRTSLVFPAATFLGRASDSGGTAYYKGHIAEYSTFSTKCGSTQYNTIRDYVNTYYALSVI